MIQTETDFIELIAEQGFELVNGEAVTNRVTLPLDSDISQWTERQIVIVDAVEAQRMNDIKALKDEFTQRLSEL